MKKNNIILTIYILVIVLFSKTISAQTLTQAEALEDIKAFEKILIEKSSYLNKSGFDYIKHVDALENDIRKQQSIDIEYFRSAFEKIVAQIGDRHSSVKYDADNKSAYPFRFLPFITAPLHGKVIALKTIAVNEYDVLFNEYPYLKSINNIEIASVLKAARPKDIKAPEKALFYRQVDELRYLEEIFVNNIGVKLNREVLFGFTNSIGSKDTIVEISLSNKRQSWNDIGDIGDRYGDIMEEGDYENLFQWKQNIAYLLIPDMTGEKKFLKALKAQMKKYKSSDALIIDIRGNGGGTRDILFTLAPYFINTDDEPWVGNVTHIRTDKGVLGDNPSMKTRYLYTYAYKKFTDRDRKAIDNFNKHFEPFWKYDQSRFSEAFYMVLSPKIAKGIYYYDKPVYILMNERCFSAASVFASVLNGLPNVTLVGQNTDGSSGRSQKYYLPNSGIRIKISTMISFQRNGKTLDGNGTKPDIEIEPEQDYIFGKKDNQLEELIEIINN